MFTVIKVICICIYYAFIRYIILLEISTTGVIPNKAREILKLLNIHPVLYSLMQSNAAGSKA